jgi:hypothetical protein
LVRHGRIEPDSVLRIKLKSCTEEDLKQWDVNLHRLSGRLTPMIPLGEPMAVAEPGAVATQEAATNARVCSGEGDPANDWLCIACLNRVASEKHRHVHEGRSEFAFRNQEGIRFEILLFSRTLGCRELGQPTLEHTWFPAHAWSFCVCDRCHAHLGWYYTGPTEFAGLIMGRIVRASVVMN